MRRNATDPTIMTSPSERVANLSAMHFRPCLLISYVILALHILQYFLFSSLRDDHFPGISPGGIATENYQGAVFMDADWWMEPPLYFLAPQLAASILQVC